MVRKVCQVDPMICPKYGATMKLIAFFTDYAVVDRIIDHLKLRFVAERRPPPQLAFQEYRMAAEASTEYFYLPTLALGGVVERFKGGRSAGPNCQQAWRIAQA